MKVDSKYGEDEVYAIIPVTEQREIVIKRDMRKTGLDIRTFLKTENYSGYTKKGVICPKEQIPELIEKLQEAYKQI